MKNIKAVKKYEQISPRYDGHLRPGSKAIKVHHIRQIRRQCRVLLRAGMDEYITPVVHNRYCGYD